MTTTDTTTDVAFDDDNPVLHGDDGDTTWMRNGICSETDPELFFPTDGNTRDSRQARELCQDCPVIQQCLQYALDRPTLEGIWGGATFKERRAIRRRRPDKKPKTVITETAIQDIVALRETTTYAAIAQQYGITVRHVARIINEKAPALGLHIERKARGGAPTDPALVSEVMALHAQGMGYTAISRELDMARSTVSSLCRRAKAAA